VIDHMTPETPHPHPAYAMPLFEASGFKFDRMS
jgi:hypothetical protein